jgi:capsule assembly protein Wzi
VRPSRRRHRLHLAAALASVAVFALAPTLRAQDTIAAPRPDTVPAPATGDTVPGRVASDSALVAGSQAAPPNLHASPLLAFDHWAVRAAWRAEALGLTRFLPAQRAVPRAEVARALRQAAANATRPALRALAEGWLARFTAEFPEYGPGGRGLGAVVPLGGEAVGGYARATGRLAAAVRTSDPAPLPDVDGARATLLAGAATPWLSASAEGAWRGGEAVLRQWDAAVGFGVFQLSVGRAPVGYGWGTTGAVVYSDPDPLPRLEFQTTRPFTLPGVLHYVGPVTLHTFAGPVNDPFRHPTDPSLWGMRVSFQPHPRLTFGANRGSMFGGSGDRATFTRLLRMLAGGVHSEFENQVVSLDARYRLPTDRVLPATAYLEWGADDAAGAMDETPARVMGLFVPALPGVPQAALGVEYTYFKHGCCGHGPWYRNATFTGHWAVHARPLGHPLGGEGAEYAAYGVADLLGARLHLDGRAWIADRSDRSRVPFGGGNLFAPQRTGRAWGGLLDGAWRILPRADLRAGWSLEDGGGWREQSLHAGFAWLF